MIHDELVAISPSSPTAAKPLLSVMTGAIAFDRPARDPTVMSVLCVER